VILPDDLEGWRDLATEIIGWMDGHWVSQGAFDAMARGRRTAPAEARPYLPGMAVLGELGGAHKELDLLQRLCRLGICEAKQDEDGRLWYRRVPDGPIPPHH